mmetsp:Transcript_110814/g.220409  ORF Transcript_110814/g.220409 Transcript_110814/m.220409 type:complete len:273 (+) Transcript_110814:136-954(+)
MATSTATHLAPSRASQAPRVNLSDMPELMPGAQPGSNPAQREEFERRCRQIYREEEHETREAALEQRAAAGSGAGASDLEAMFPLLDPGLVRAMHAEAPTPQHAIETLLALNAAMAPGDDEKAVQRAASPPPRQLGVEDHSQFPTLTDGNGWQVVNQTTLDEEPKEELGSIWRDRAKAAADIPAPRAAPPSNAPAWGAKQRQRRPKDNADREEYVLPTDYDMRQKLGERRARQRAQYGRGASGRAAGTTGAGAQLADEADEEEDEDGEEGLC